MLAPARLRAFLSISIIVEGVTRSIHEVLGSSYNGFVFVAYDGGFLCRTCVESPCTEMVAATCDYDESELPIECGQWCIVGAQEPELGHGDTCDHCGAWTLPPPVDADVPVVEPLWEARKRECLRDLDVLQGGTMPWWLRENVDRYFGGDCDGRQ